MSRLSVLLSHYQGTLNLIDVGARWGSNERWKSLEAISRIICFEPDSEECVRLNAATPDNISYIPVALSDAEGERDIYLTRELACSSMYRPNSSLYKHYPPLHIIEPVSVTSVPCQRLDDVLAPVSITQVDAIKIDVQGAELDVLRGAVKSLERCSLIDIEVEFNPIYDGQALFCDVDRFMRDHGFALWRLENLVHYSPEIIPDSGNDFLIASEPGQAVHVAVPNGQVFWAQAQYVRKDYPRTGAELATFEQILPGAIIAGVYGFWDLAVELLRKCGRDDIISAVLAEPS